MENKMKPFNLQEAMAGKPVQTRDGREVTQLKFFEDVNINLIVGVVAKNIWTWNMKGQSDSLSGKSKNDLFMVFEKKVVWANVYQNHDDIYLGSTFSTKAIAIESKALTKDGPTYYIKTIEITNEPWQQN